MLNDTLDYSLTAKHVAQAATRALGLLISKFKTLGGMPFQVYTKLYDSMVWPIISYGAAIWGTKEYFAINAVQHRACRFFLGVGKYTPNAAVTGDMGWIPPIVRQWKTVIGHWFRLNNLEETRINHTVFKWTHQLQNSTKNWCYKVEHETNSVANLTLTAGEIYSIMERRNFINTFQETLFEKINNKWYSCINAVHGVSGLNNGNKLRNYKQFKSIYKTEAYVKNDILPRSHRSALSKFRCGVAPLKIETGRYQSLPINERTCFHCDNIIEDETHVLMRCPLYDNLRNDLLSKALNINADFSNYSMSEKFNYLLSHENIVKYSAKTCYSILTERRNHLYK